MNPLAKIAFNMVMKQLFKKFDLNKINKYVNEDNELDEKWGSWYRYGTYVDHLGNLRKRFFKLDKWSERTGVIIEDFKSSANLMEFL